MFFGSRLEIFIISEIGAAMIRDWTERSNMISKIILAGQSIGRYGSVWFCGDSQIGSIKRQAPSSQPRVASPTQSLEKI